MACKELLPRSGSSRILSRCRVLPLPIMKGLRSVRSVVGTIHTSICGWVERGSGKELSVLVKEDFSI